MPVTEFALFTLRDSYDPIELLETVMECQEIQDDWVRANHPNECAKRASISRMYTDTTTTPSAHRVAITAPWQSPAVHRAWIETPANQGVMAKFATFLPAGAVPDHTAGCHQPCDNNPGFLFFHMHAAGRRHVLHEAFTPKEALVVTRLAAQDAAGKEQLQARYAELELALLAAAPKDMPTPTKSSRFCVMPENTAPYQTRGLPPMPAVSRQTLPMGGLLVDVYGLDELPAGDRSALPTTCLWLLHPRTRARGHMADIASRVLAAWHAAAAPQTTPRNLVALAFDMPNHGSRLVSAAANEAWDGGNATHAVDMLGMVKGAVADMAGLMDLVEAYLGLRAADAAHVCLGWSLGGHSAWQAWIGEDRIDAAVVVVGCPDFTNLMSTRAAAGNLLVPAGSSFLGSSHFPPSLARVCAAHDPKALLFGADDNHRRRPVPDVPLGEDDRERVRSVLDRHRVAGKRLLLCSGGRDTLVPAAVGQPVVDVLTEASAGWYPAMSVESRVYEDVGHAFSKDMVTDAVAFLVDAVARGPREGESKAKI